MIRNSGESSAKCPPFHSFAYLGTLRLISSYHYAPLDGCPLWVACLYNKWGIIKTAVFSSRTHLNQIQCTIYYSILLFLVSIAVNTDTARETGCPFVLACNKLHTTFRIVGGTANSLCTSYFYP